jgi:hypothetical protein
MELTLPEKDIGLKLKEIIGVSKGSLQIFNQHLLELFENGCFKNTVQQFYDIKEELVNFWNDFEEKVIIPVEKMLYQDPQSPYQFVMLELLDRIHLMSKRKELDRIPEKADPDMKLICLWRLCHDTQDVLRISLTIADLRMDELD